MSGTLFVLDADLSGINAYLFASLRMRGWRVRVRPVGVDPSWKWPVALGAFALPRWRWKRRYHRALARRARTKAGLGQRTVRCSRLLERDAGPDDVLLVFGTLFAPTQLRWTRPYAVFKDYTTALARRADPAALPVHGSDLQRWMQQERETCRHAGVVFTASDNTRRSLIDDYGVSAQRVVTVGEGLCFDALPDAPERGLRAPGRGSVLFVGRDFHRKGGDLVLRAFEHVRARCPGARLTLAGFDTPRPRHDRGDVDWRGPISDRACLRALYRSADVFVMPSRCEPFGLVFLEAMAHGLPCVGVRRDAMPEIIADGVTGYLIEPGDHETLAVRLIQLLARPQRARAMGRHGYQRVATRFLWSHVVERMHPHLDALRPC